MGGYFSTRWNYERTRADTDGLLRLDVRHMQRTGVFHPGAHATWQWTRDDGESAGTIQTRINRAGDCLTLDYATRRDGDDDWTPRKIVVWLESTPCHYGGRRVWVRCPNCHLRRAVLFSAGGVFSCRSCHDLAYSSTREDAMERAYRRIRALQRRLGAPAGCRPWHIPEKPARMHWTTYGRLVAQLYAAIMEREEMFEERAAKLIGSVDHLIAEREYLRP